MLQADKQALARELRLNMLNIQWKELDFLYTNFQNLAVCSAALVGYGVANFGLGVSTHPEDVTDQDSIWQLPPARWETFEVVIDIVVATTCIATLSVAVAWFLLSLYIGTLASICGPGLALCGAEGSVGISVRHLESSLKRALRFFGRGIVAFTLCMCSMGFRALLKNVTFIGGIITVIVSLYTLNRLWVYGGNIAEKFHVSPDKAMRGAFIDGPGGASIWMNTADEVAQIQVSPGWSCCGIEFGGRIRRWRPEGHGVTTPLWRLDKFLSFPYSDDAALEEQLCAAAEGHQGRRVDLGARGEREQAQRLVLAAQGPTQSPDVAGGHGGPSTSAEYAADFDVNFDPLRALQMVGRALGGGAVESSRDEERYRI